MEASDIIKLAEYAEKLNNPAVTIAIVLIVAFVLFFLARKFVTNEYVTAGKEAFDEQCRIYKELKTEHEALKLKNAELEEKIRLLELEILSLKKDT